MGQSISIMDCSLIYLWKTILANTDGKGSLNQNEAKSTIYGSHRYFTLIIILNYFPIKFV